MVTLLGIPAWKLQVEVPGYKTQQSWRNLSLEPREHLFPHCRNLYQLSFLFLGVLSCSLAPRHLLVDDGRGLAPQQPGQVVCCIRRRRGLVEPRSSNEPLSWLAWGSLPLRAQNLQGNLHVGTFPHVPGSEHLSDRGGERTPLEISMIPQDTEASSCSSFFPAAANP